MVLYSDDQLSALYPYADDHPLRCARSRIEYGSECLPAIVLLSRRRSQVNPESPDLQRFPQFRICRGYEALLREGDILLFGSKVMHYTQSLGPKTCMSITTRFE